VTEANSGWRVTANRTLLRDRWIHLRAESYVTPAGAVIDPYYVHDWPDWVLVVALTPADELVLVRIWRPPVRAYVLEPVAGMIDAGESDPVVTARRELLEETGFTAEEFQALPWAPFTDPARNTNRMHVVLARNAHRIAEPKLEEAEDLQTVLMPVADVLRGLPQGMLGHGLQYGGVLLALQAAGRISF